MNPKSNLEKYAKIPPQATDIEAAILGALMLEPEAIHQTAGLIDRNTFYLQSHGIIFEAITELAKLSRPVDLLIVTKALKDAGKLEEVGGPLFVTQLTSGIASVAHLNHYCRIISQLAIQRELIKIGSELQAQAYEEGAEIEDLLTDLKTKISDIENIATTGNDGSAQPEVLNETIQEIEADCIRAKEGTTPGIQTGLKALDRITGGWRNTQLVIIAARPAIGKTSLALHFTTFAAKAGHWVNFYGLEMKNSDLQRIIISGEANVNRTSIRDGLVTEPEWTKINLASRTLESLPIIWNDSPVTADTIKAKTIKNRRQGRCDLVVIDYLQLMTPSDKKAIREQQIAGITRTLKQLALSENVPIILLSQLNREASNDTPQLHHLRESGAIEQDADVVIFPTRKEKEYSLIIAKNRRGKCATFEIYANEEMTRFGNIGSDPGNIRPGLNYNPNATIEPAFSENPF